MEIFASLYERILNIYDSNYHLIFYCQYDNKAYLYYGLLFLLLPLSLWALFYLVWKNPYGKWFHWLLWLIIITILTGISTYTLSEWMIFESPEFIQTCSELQYAIQDINSGYQLYAETLPLKYAIYHSLLSVVLGILYSFILKQFSKIQTHLPF